MAPLLEDPRIRQTWNQFSQNAESATENAAAGIWTFQHRYITPCLSSIAEGFEQCTGQCFPDREERARRLRERGRTRGRAELSFDFYDDWDVDEDGGHQGLLGGWGNDELDRLLAGSGSHSGGSGATDQPRRKRGMSYGTRGRRKSLEADPTVIPSTSALGFLGRLPFKLGGTLRYKPSAADLQDHPGALRSDYREEEGEPLIADDSEDEGTQAKKGHVRNRSSTASSGETTDSFRSRGDLFPSDGEDDAVPLDDEFAMALERRMTNDGSSGKTRSSKGKKPALFRTVSRGKVKTGISSPSHSRPSLSSKRTSSATSVQRSIVFERDMIQTPSISDFQQEEERLRYEEEAELERKRQAAVSLAIERGLHAGELSEVFTEMKVEPTGVNKILPPLPTESETTRDVARNPSSTDLTLDKTASPAVETQGEHFIPARLPHFG